MLASSLDAAFGIVREAVEKENVPGAIALVAQQGKIIREEAFGLCDIESKRPKVAETLKGMFGESKDATNRGRALILSVRQRD